MHWRNNHLLILCGTEAIQIAIEVITLPVGAAIEAALRVANDHHAAVETLVLRHVWYHKHVGAADRRRAHRSLARRLNYVGPQTILGLEPPTMVVNETARRPECGLGRRSRRRSDRMYVERRPFDTAEQGNWKSANFLTKRRKF